MAAASLADKDYIDKCVQNGYFTAGTPQELASFVYYVNTQPVEQGQLSLVLTADIDLYDYKWAPMGWSGGGNSDHPFSFCVYGENHKITYMTIYSDYSNAGFIGWGTVCGVFDLDIENAIVTGDDNVGVLTGQAIMGNYQNCHVSGTVNGSSAGSLLGYEANCDKENCTADVEVNGKKFDFLSWNEQQKSEIKIDDPVTITIDESYTVTRPEVTGYSNLGWMVYEDGKYYPAMRAVHGEMPLWQEVELQYGKYLLEEKHPVLEEYLKDKQKTCRKIQEKLAADGKKAEKITARQKELEDELRLIGQALEVYER